MPNCQTQGAGTNENKTTATHPDKHPQTAFHSNTHLELLKGTNPGRCLNTLCPRSFFPFPCLMLTAWEENTSLQSVRALNSLPLTGSTTWGCLLSWGSSFVTDAERGHSPQSDTPEYPAEKTPTYPDSTGTWLCLICSRAFLLSQLTVFYRDTHLWDSHHLWSLHTGCLSETWDITRSGVFASPHSHAQGLIIFTTSLPILF